MEESVGKGAMEAGEVGGSCEKDSQAVPNSDGEVSSEVASALIVLVGGAILGGAEGSEVTLEEDWTSPKAIVGDTAAVELREEDR